MAGERGYNIIVTITTLNNVNWESLTDIFIEINTFLFDRITSYYLISVPFHQRICVSEA